MALKYQRAVGVVKPVEVVKLTTIYDQKTKEIIKHNDKLKKIIYDLNIRINMLQSKRDNLYNQLQNDRRIIEKDNLISELQEDLRRNDNTRKEQQKTIVELQNIIKRLKIAVGPDFDKLIKGE